MILENIGIEETNIDEKNESLIVEKKSYLAVKRFFDILGAIFRLDTIISIKYRNLDC